MKNLTLNRWFCWVVLYEIPDDKALRQLRIIIRVLAGRNRLLRVSNRQVVLCVYSNDYAGLRAGLRESAKMTNIKIIAVAMRHSLDYPEAG